MQEHNNHMHADALVGGASGHAAGILSSVCEYLKM